jgi:hypothetical protein
MLASRFTDAAQNISGLDAIHNAGVTRDKTLANMDEGKIGIWSLTST